MRRRCFAGMVVWVSVFVSLLILSGKGLAAPSAPTPYKAKATAVVQDALGATRLSVEPVNRDLAKPG